MKTFKSILIIIIVLGIVVAVLGMTDKRDLGVKDVSGKNSEEISVPQ